MLVDTVVLVEPAQAGNLGAAIRVAANFGVRRVALVRPQVNPLDPEVERWACGGDRLVVIDRYDDLESAISGLHRVAATASGRGRDNLPLITPREAAHRLFEHGAPPAGLVFGNETSGLRRVDLDRCDMVVGIPAVPEFRVLNLAQSVGILLATVAMSSAPESVRREPPASQEMIADLMDHLRSSLLTIGFLDPASPDRILRKLRRLFGRAAITENEVAILRGICRQMEWAAHSDPGRYSESGGAD